MGEKLEKVAKSYCDAAADGAAAAALLTKT